MSVRSFLVPLGTALLGVLASAAASGMLVSDAAAYVTRRKESDDEPDAPLLLVPVEEPSMLVRHRSHSSHRSHRSHSSGSGGGHYSGYSPSPSPSPDPRPAPSPPPAPPKPGRVSIAAYPGGRITVDGVPRGTDVTGVLTLSVGSHTVVVENKFLGTHTASVTIYDGQVGTVNVSW